MSSRAHPRADGELPVSDFMSPTSRFGTEPSPHTATGSVARLLGHLLSVLYDGATFHVRSVHYNPLRPWF